MAPFSIQAFSLWLFAISIALSAAQHTASCGLGLITSNININASATLIFSTTTCPFAPGSCNWVWDIGTTTPSISITSTNLNGTITATKPTASTGAAESLTLVMDWLSVFGISMLLATVLMA